MNIFTKLFQEVVCAMGKFESRKVHLFVFGGGSFNFRRASRRLAIQGRSVELFSSVTSFTDHDLKVFIPDSGKQHIEFIRSNKRGFGYWLWKPYLVNYALRKIPANDILVYLDSGIELNLSSRPAITRWNEYLNFVDKYNSLAFQLESKTNLVNKPGEIQYSKKYLIDFMLPSNLSLMSNQISASAFLLKNTQSNIQFIEEWIYIATLDNYKYLTDCLADEENDSFIEHRHDQSIFSLLYKKREMFFIPDETDVANNTSLESDLPIWMARNRSGISRGPIKTDDRLDKLFNFFKARFLQVWQYIMLRLVRLCDKNFS